MVVPGAFGRQKVVGEGEEERGVCRRRWPEHGGEGSSLGPYGGEAVDANKHAIAVAAATAAVAEAAIAAAHAAAEVVRLTSGVGGEGGRPPPPAYNGEWRRELAAVRIQSAFRAYLARRALRALKGLVRLQALVRGHMVRKHSADMLRRMQALARIQARARANRVHTSESTHSSAATFSQSQNPGITTPKKFDEQLRTYGSKSDRSTVLKRSPSKSKIKDTTDQARAPLSSNRLETWMEECSRTSPGDTPVRSARADDDKILEVDTWMPHLNSKQSNRIHRTSQQNPIISSNEAPSLKSLKLPSEADQVAAWTTDNSPQMFASLSRPGSSNRRGPFSPTRSECSRSLFGDYLGYPSYMANTESSLAKMRSQSAPRQRMQLEKLGSTKRFVRGYWDAETFSERGSSLNPHLRNITCSASGHLDRLGMPVQGHGTARYNLGHGSRY
ncbi:hypothetical protein NMG60_11018144 [Bertholletia excelsa]